MNIGFVLTLNSLQIKFSVCFVLILLYFQVSAAVVSNMIFLVSFHQKMNSKLIRSEMLKCLEDLKIISIQPTCLNWVNARWKSSSKTTNCTKMKISTKDFFSACDQIRRKLRIRSHLLKKSLMVNFIFCVVTNINFK